MPKTKDLFGKEREVPFKLRTFANFPDEKICPICGTGKKGECLLIPKSGTQDGNICEAVAFHTGCLNLTYQEEDNIIFQVLKNKK